MKREMILKYIPIFVIVILGLIRWFLDSDLIKYTAEHLIILGIVYICYQLISIEEKNEKLIAKLQDTIKLLSNREFKNSNLLSLISYGYRDFDPKDFPKIWSNLMWNTKFEFWSSNYIHPDHLWDNKFAETALLIQQAKIANENVSMNRLFIYENEQELKQLLKAIDINCKAGLHVYSICRDEILNIPHLRNCLQGESENSIDTLAFNLIDNKSALLYKLDNDRKVESFKLVVDEKVCSNYKDFYLNVIKSAKKHS